MIIFIIDKIVDLTKDIFLYKKTKNRIYFKEIIEPLFELFEQVHQEYILTFKKCMDYIKTSKSLYIDNQGLLNILYEDNLFTNESRIKLFSIYEQIENKNVKNKKFILSIYNYLTYPFDSYYPTFNKNQWDFEVYVLRNGKTILKNPIRASVIEMIERGILPFNKKYKEKFKGKKSRAYDIFAELVYELQLRYSAVFEEYIKYKEEYLK